MKRIYIAIVLLLISASVCFSEYTLVKNTSEHYIQKLEYIEKEYKLDKTKALKLCNEFSKELDESASPMDAFLFHDYIDDIRVNAHKLQILLKDDNTSMFKTTCEELKIQLTSLKNSEVPILENII